MSTTIPLLTCTDVSVRVLRAADRGPGGAHGLGPSTPRRRHQEQAVGAVLAAHHPTGPSDFEAPCSPEVIRGGARSCVTVDVVLGRTGVS